MVLKIVVLPAPFGPTSPRISPRLDFEIHVVDSPQPAEMDETPVDIKHGR